MKLLCTYTLHIKEYWNIFHTYEAEAMNNHTKRRRIKHLENALQMPHSFHVHPKRLRKINAVDGGLGRQNGVREIRNPGVLAVERHHRHGVPSSDITHGVHEPHGHHKHVAFPHNFGEVVVGWVGGYESDFQGSL